MHRTSSSIYSHCCLSPLIPNNDSSETKNDRENWINREKNTSYWFSHHPLKSPSYASSFTSEAGKMENTKIFSRLSYSHGFQGGLSSVKQTHRFKPQRQKWAKEGGGHVEKEGPSRKHDECVWSRRVQGRDKSSLGRATFYCQRCRQLLSSNAMAERPVLKIYSPGYTVLG